MFPYERLQYGLNFVMRTKEKKVATKKKIITIRFEINCLFCKKKKKILKDVRNGAKTKKYF